MIYQILAGYFNDADELTNEPVLNTILNTFGKQEGVGYNYHYSANGYHPLLCYDGLTEDLLKAELRDGTDIHLLVF